MRWFSRSRSESGRRGPLLEITELDVYYGRAHALQGVTLTLERGVTAVVGRNGMGKTTLCNAVTGLVRATGSVRLAGEEILVLAANEISRRGIAYVPQGRRTWPSLTVDEHLRLVARGGSRWTVERIYSMFPRLAERKGNGGAQLSGGEQQMLAIGRALLLDPRVLVMDEPTEGLAPAIVEQVVEALRGLAGEGELAVLLIEQNLGVAIDVADSIAVMVNGRIAREMPAAALAADRELQERLLGVRSHGEDAAAVDETPPAPAEPAQVFRVQRQFGDGVAAPTEAAPRTVFGVNRWNAQDADATRRELPRSAPAPQPPQPASVAPVAPAPARVFEFPVAVSSARAAYIAGTFDTKGRELNFLKQCIDRLGLRTVTVDLATSGASSTASVSAREVARHHPQGERAVFSGDRGTAVIAMALAFERFILSRRDLGGIVAAGGSGGTALATQAMRALPIGVPKLMISTVASGDVRPYVGPSDICMMYSVTDVSGINRISEKVLANAAHALAGMVAHRRPHQAHGKPAVGLTMFGVTTTCVQAVQKLLGDEVDTLVFHATGTGGQSMEKLAESNLLSAVLDLTTTEICDELVGGVLSAGPQRLDAIAHSRVPYVGSCGALDMVNFWAWDTVPAKFRERNLYKHNANVTLMRTTAGECTAIGEFIARKLNAMTGPVRFVIPEGGVSALDAPGMAFWDPAADQTLFAAIESNFRPAGDRRLIRTPLHINDPAFAELILKLYREVSSRSPQRLAR
jgi:uncharacterized protein (UPF0261 family)/ABC-type branched-subunit amino acid transport system ATPase component